MYRSTVDVQYSSLENFVDEYQQIRLLASVAGIVIVGAFVVGGWWQEGSPVPNLAALSLMAGHAAWCRARHIRAPKIMLIMDTSLLGAVMLTIPDSTAVMSGTFAFLALLIALFTQGMWLIGLLVYATAWYVAAHLKGSGVSAESVGVLVGGLLAVVAVMIGVRRWPGRLDATRSQMVGTVSHELRNNLTGVLGLTEVVATMDDLEPAEARELVTLAHQQAVDASDIVEDLLTVSTLEGSAVTTSKEAVDVNEEVVATTRRFQRGTEIGLALVDDPSGTGRPLASATDDPEPDLQRHPLWRSDGGHQHRSERGHDPGRRATTVMVSLPRTRPPSSFPTVARLRVGETPPRSGSACGFVASSPMRWAGIWSTRDEESGPSSCSPSRLHPPTRTRLRRRPRFSPTAEPRRPLPPVGRARCSQAPRRSRISSFPEAPVADRRSQILR